MSSAGYIEEFNFAPHRVRIEHYSDTTQCYDFVKAQSEKFWDTRTNRKSEENYFFENSKKWSLGSMLLERAFDLGYSLLFIDGEFQAGGGVRKLNSETSISLSRFFSVHSPIPFGNAFLLPLHMRLSQQQGFEKTVLTFNNYNSHLARYYQNVLPHKKDAISCRAYEYLKDFKHTGEHEINFVQQTVFEYSLKPDGKL